MIKNVGTADRTIRIAVGLALLSLTVLFDSGLRWFGLIGLVPLLTGLTGWCPAYQFVGISTCGSQTRLQT